MNELASVVGDDRGDAGDGVAVVEVHDADAGRVTALRRDVADRASSGAGETSASFQAAGALEPPYDPEGLCLLVEHSNALRQNLDAYAVNIDGFGHRFEPAIDFEAEDADARVSGGMRVESSRDGEVVDLAALETRAAKHLLVLLLPHALAALLDERTHEVDEDSWREMWSRPDGVSGRLMCMCHRRSNASLSCPYEVDDRDGSRQGGPVDGTC